MDFEDALHLEEYIETAIARLERMHKGEARLKTVRDFVGKIANSRWVDLLTLARKNDGSEIQLVEAVDMVSVEVIGRARHLVLFRQVHLKAFAEFVEAMQIRPTQLRLLRTINMSDELHKVCRVTSIAEVFQSSSCQ